MADSRKYLCVVFTVLRSERTVGGLGSNRDTGAYDPNHFHIIIGAVYPRQGEFDLRPLPFFKGGQMPKAIIVNDEIHFALKLSLWAELLKKKIVEKKRSISKVADECSWYNMEQDRHAMHKWLKERKYQFEREPQFTKRKNELKEFLLGDSMFYPDDQQRMNMAICLEHHPKVSGYEHPNYSKWQTDDIFPHDGWMEIDGITYSPDDRRLTNMFLERKWIEPQLESGKPKGHHQLTQEGMVLPKVKAVLGYSQKPLPAVVFGFQEDS